MGEQVPSGGVDSEQIPAADDEAAHERTASLSMRNKRPCGHAQTGYPLRNEERYLAVQLGSLACAGSSAMDGPWSTGQPTSG